MKINEKEMLMMLQDKMLKAAYFMKQRKEYLNNSSFEQMLTDLNERGIIIKENEVVEKYKELTLAIKSSKFVCGYCYTQLTDTYQETNGILDFDHKPKLDLKRIKEINDME